ncbi:hypothetical protein [Lysinibacillus odysseyi]|uniref:Uncharacterized protein n=1 Tax=Lysinibacillus odysseyi 34hs-1 = NBRC 100172 TaxID=1220589 RepID=A0A0A3IXN6_9BACI|nr:hypothetical protein [Lysinibacillus odysseyi]KGR89471.1 hypothetical protein CD32_00305 [Lysinibacillus odysseyi 34hs-1 = NBRC 100172]
MNNNNYKNNLEDATRNISEVAKEILRNSNSEKVTENDTTSTSEYMSNLKDALNSVNKEIQESESFEEKSELYKQREDILNRMREEKANQRVYQADREENERTYNKQILGVVGAIALGVGTTVLKTIIENKKI